MILGLPGLGHSTISKAPLVPGPGYQGFCVVSTPHVPVGTLKARLPHHTGHCICYMAVNTRNTCQGQSQLELEMAGGVVQILDGNTEGHDVLTQEEGPEARWTREA